MISLFQRENFYFQEFVFWKLTLKICEASSYEDQIILKDFFCKSNEKRKIKLLQNFKYEPKP